MRKLIAELCDANKNPNTGKEFKNQMSFNHVRQHLEHTSFSKIEIEKIEPVYNRIFPQYEEQFVRLHKYLLPIEIYADYAEVLHYYIEKKNPKTAHFKKLFKAQLQDLVKTGFLVDSLSGSDFAIQLRRKFVDHLIALETYNARASIENDIKRALNRAFEELEAYGATRISNGF